MGNDDKTLKDIDAGKGLKPIQTQSANQTSGLAIEQRGQESGVRFDRFSKQNSPDEDKGK